MSDDPYQPGSKEDFDRLYRTSYPKVFRAQLRAVGEVLRRLGRPAQPPDPADQATRPDLLRALRTIPPKAGRGDRPSGARTESPEPSESPEAAPTAGPTEKPEATNSPEAADTENEAEDNDTETGDNEGDHQQSSGGDHESGGGGDD